MKTLLLCTLFIVGCVAIPQADGTVKQKLDPDKVVEATTAVAPFIPQPFGAILMLAGPVLAAFRKKD